MITLMIIVGALFLTAFGLYFINKKLVPLLIIPALFAIYFMNLHYYASLAGYGVDKLYISEELTMHFLGAYEKDKYLYVFVQEKGVDEPRLLRFPASKENQESMKKIKKQAEKGPQFFKIKKPKGLGAKKGSAGDESDIADLTGKIEGGVLEKDD
jgi:hypothetical protein